MIDFIKCEVTGIAPEVLQVNNLLEFATKLNYNTGELGVYLHAFYKGLEFKVFNRTTANPKGRITLEGSLHKYWNNGGHNFNDFNISAIKEVLEDLKKSFGIIPQNCQIKQLEIGVNLKPPFSTEKILQCCLLHKTTLFKWVFTNDEGNYIQVQHGNYYVKIYDKQKHYQNKGFTVPDEILRFEIKYKREKLAKALNLSGAVTLQQVLNFRLKNFNRFLLLEWQNVLFYDFTSLDQTKWKDKYSNQNYWSSLKPENFKYHRRNLNKITDANPANLKKRIEVLISEKVDFLCSETTRIKPLNIPLIQVGKGNNFKSTKSKVCAVTGLNIEMQKEDSFLLSHEGLKHYFRTDRKVYNEVKRKHLSNLWKTADHKIQIKEIAHDIRNTINNRRIKQKRLYPEHQIQLFKLEEVG